MGRSGDATTPTDRRGSCRQYAVGTHARNPKRRASHPRNPRLACRAGRRGLALSRSVGAGAGAARHEGRPIRRGRQHHACASRLALSFLGADRSFLVCHAGSSARPQRLLRDTRSLEHVREPTRADEHRNTVGPRAAHRHHVHAVPHHVVPVPCCWLRHVGARDRQDRRPHLRRRPGTGRRGAAPDPCRASRPGHLLPHRASFGRAA
jgi:hypothetical protein